MTAQGGSLSAVILTAKDIQDQAGRDTVRDVLETIANITLVTGTGEAPTVRGMDGTGPAENANAFSPEAAPA
ncbi:hypothetical protein [Niveispirillum cyanobacteriorum]|uniref:Uncharacterized protein n=1 Tax=Niveispirillum cyanobacteriorum TaxID=1612173 RepID=A0A2K9NK12_9PROT|nr:hypothetical protein [Niveispirillum cyanobacteriorum]AUN32675.1 hypothetical protein C0V82_20365 [Niveispirillum cyanobacteriorum]GGE83180.1 hypothetical protein GCM10011317_45520 [Niveispirillum cyanobacteriorum]